MMVHITPLLCGFHWMPVCFQLIHAFKALHHMGFKLPEEPSYPHHINLSTWSSREGILWTLSVKEFQLTWFGEESPLYYCLCTLEYYPPRGEVGAHFQSEDLTLPTRMGVPEWRAILGIVKTLKPPHFLTYSIFASYLAPILLMYFLWFLYF